MGGDRKHQLHHRPASCADGAVPRHRDPISVHSVFARLDRCARFSRHRGLQDRVRRTDQHSFHASHRCKRKTGDRVHRHEPSGGNIRYRRYFQKAGTPLVLTHCVSAYPCPYNRVNLGMVPRLAELFGVPTGLSCHTPSIYTALGAVALGACVIEKHFTFDRTQKGPDHRSSIEGYELGELVKGCRAVWEARGATREIFPEEQQIVAWARESVVSLRPIPRGTSITDDMVSVKRPSPGPGVVPARDLDKVIGAVARSDIPADKQIRWNDI